jgi:hypothetical protein
MELGKGRMKIQIVGYINIYGYSGYIRKFQYDIVGILMGIS